MKLLNVPPIKAGQYARYGDINKWYVWKCTDVRKVESADRQLWYVNGVIVYVHGFHSFRSGRPVQGQWCAYDTLLTEEETNAIIERTTV